MGKSSKPTIGYRHFMGLYMGESHGENDYLSAIDVGGESAWQGMVTTSGTVYIDRPMLFGGDKKEGGIVGALTVRMGEAAQVPDAYLVSQVPGPWPAARGLCTTVFDGQVGAMNPYVKLWKKQWGRFVKGWSTPVWQPALAKIGRGMNPIHIIYQCLTDNDWGLGFSPTIIDEASFLSAAQTLYDEEFGLCLPWRRSDPVGNFIQIVNNHIAGQWAHDPRLDKITYRLFRDDYYAEDLPLLDESNIIKLESWQQTSLDASTNEITVIGRNCITNKDIAATYQNLANVQAQGRVISEKKQFPGLWNNDLCARVAARETAIASSLLCRVKVTVKRDLWGIKRGGVYALSWARKGVVRMPMRVLEVDEGTRTDSKIGLVLFQDISGMADTTYIKPAVTVWQPPNTAPKVLPAQEIYEASYRDLAGFLRAPDLAALAVDAGFVVSLGARPAGPAYNYVLTTRTGSADFKEVGSGDFSPTGLLEAAMSSDADDVGVVLTGGRDLDLVTIGSEAKIDDEYFRVDAIDPVTGEATLARGCVDSVPVVHALGARVWFTDVYVGADPTEYIDGETVDAKLLCRTRQGTLDPSLAPTANVMMNKRQARPYPPGRVRVEAVAAPAIVSGVINIGWAHRDRLLQLDQLVDSEATSIGPEATTRYALRFLDASEYLIIEKLDLDGDSATAVLNYTGAVTMELYSISDNGESRQRNERTFGYTPPPGTTVSVINGGTYTPDEYVLDGGGA